MKTNDAVAVPPHSPDSGRGSAGRADASTRMYAEAGEAPQRVRLQLDEDANLMQDLAVRLRGFGPRAMITCARGSSDHAATYARYLVETRMGLLTASASPSVSSIYGVKQDFSQCLFLAISQSGSSPDLLATAAAAKAGGALVVALVNAEGSPLAALADHWLPMRAGKESSVAATKSYICSLSAIAHLVARWVEDHSLLRALAWAPEQLAAAWQLDWERLVEVLIPAQHLFVLARGVGLGAAQEAALKLKETCALHAEAFSSAEVQHGPMALLTKDLPVLMFCQNDATRAGMETLARELSSDGVRTLIAGGSSTPVDELPTLAANPAIEPMLLVQSFYKAAVTLAIARGLDPDRPPRLRKVTRTC